jgi:hypothetical protein
LNPLSKREDLKKILMKF